MGWATSAPKAASDRLVQGAARRLMRQVTAGSADAPLRIAIEPGELPFPSAVTLTGAPGHKRRDDGPPHGAADHCSSEVAVMLLAQMAPGSRLWGGMRLVLGRFAMRGVAGLRFFKILGSGHDGGFGLRPSADRLGLFTVFADAAAAEAFLAASPVAQAWRAHARETAWLALAPYSSRGSWAGRALATSIEPPSAGPIAVLTRASIRPRRAVAFWRRAPAAERSLQAAAGCLLATGLGEAPVLRQATFSVWQDTDSLQAYAQQGAHLEAVRAAYGGGYFSESMFTRFALLSMGGVWQGRVLDEAPCAERGLD